MSEGYRLVVLILAPSLLLGWILANLIRGAKPDCRKTGTFQFCYWQLLVAVIIGSLWSWALIDLTILEGQRAGALRAKREQTILRIRDEVAIEACRAFLSDHLTDEKRKELTAVLLRFQEADPQITMVAIGGALTPGPPIGTVIGIGGRIPAQCAIPTDPDVDAIAVWNGKCGREGRDCRSVLLSIAVVLPEQQDSKARFRLYVSFCDD